MDSRKINSKPTESTNSQSVNNVLDGEINKGFKLNEQASSRSDVSSDFVVVSDVSPDLTKIDVGSNNSNSSTIKGSSKDLIPLVPIKSNLTCLYKYLNHVFKICL